MTTVGLYGNSPSGVVAAATGSESTGLYGNNVNFGGSYFEWFIFIQADTQPATPTGGSWNFTTNSGTPPAGWSTTPFANPTNKIWVSIALVSSKNTSSLVWSAPGLFSYASGLPILSGANAPQPTDGQSDQLYIETGTTPETIWFKQAGTWTRLTGSSLYVDLTNNQTIAGTKTFSSTIQGSVSGTASNVTGVVGITNGGTGSTTASGARTALGAAASGANSDITSMAALTGDIASPISISMGNGNAVTLAAGRMWYSPNTGAWNLGMGGGNITQQVGEELFLYGKASAAITDSPLQIVYQTGTVGASGVVTFAPTVAGITNGDLIVGIATENIALNGFGRVTTFGVIHGITTNGTAYGETWADGDTIWYNPVTGNPTKNKPSAPNIKVSLGTVISAGPGGSGSFQVEINHGSVLGGTDSNVQLTSVANANLLQYDSAAGYWKNVAPSAVTGVGSLANALTIGTGLSGTSYNGSSTVTIANTGVLSFSAGTTGLTPSTATTGAVTLAGTLSVANGGTGVTTSTGTGSVVLATSPTLVTPALGTPSSGNFSTGTFTWPTFNQNTTGNATTATTATNVSGGTASVTTLTTSSTVTLNGGTANGVAYLNASKVLTTGSALTFDGTNFAIAGGLFSGDARLGQSGTKDIAVIVGNTAGSGAQIRALSFNEGAYAPLTSLASFFVWSPAGSEQMRLTSTGLGIGTSSPGVKLDVVGIARSNTSFDLNNGTVTGTYGAGAFTGSAVGIGSTSNHPLVFGTNSGERMRLDSSGNLGLGVTPSASQANGVLFLKNNGQITFSGPASYFDTNIVYNSGADRYIANGTASRIAQLGGSFQFLTAPSGTAGNAISFNQAMTLDASGRLSIGTTGTVFSGLTVQAQTSTGGGVGIINDATLNYGRLDFLSASNGGYTRIKGDGRATGFIAFETNDTERARIDASGNLLVGTTSASGSNSGSFYFVPGTGSFAGVAVIQHSTSNVSGSGYINFNYNGSAIGSISQSGTTAVLYNVTSDQRLKENIADADDASVLIDAIQVRKYDWKSDGTHHRYGFIAQELVTVAPEAVHQPADPEEMMAVDYSKLVPMLVKEIQSLRKRISALEAK